MSQLTTKVVFFFSVVLPSLAANNSTTYKYHLRLDDFESLVAEQAEVIDNLNRTIQEQAQIITDHSSITQAMNQTIQGPEAELNILKTDVNALNKSIGESQHQQH